MTASQPRIGTLYRLNGASYAVIMVDLDVPTNDPPNTDTLLRWIQACLIPSVAPTQMNTTLGTLQVYFLEDPPASNTNISAGTVNGPERNITAAGIAVPYVGPNPPARTPLSHRYVQLLVYTSNMTADGAEALRPAAASAVSTTRRAFDTSAVLEAAGLGGKVVAGNSFNVTNAGPSLTRRLTLTQNLGPDLSLMVRAGAGLATPSGRRLFLTEASARDLGVC